MLLIALLQFDTVIHIGDVLMLIVTLILLPAVRAFGAAVFTLRDDMVLLRRQMGADDPPSGVLGDIAHSKRELRRHRDWLIEANIIHPGDRT